MPRASRNDLPREKVRWNGEKDLFLDIKSTYRAGDSVVIPVTVRNIRRLDAIRFRLSAAPERRRLRAVTDLNKDNFFVWIEDRPNGRRRSH